MEALPAELIDTILGSTNALVWPALQRVCTQWRLLLSRRRGVKPRRAVHIYVQRRFIPIMYRYRCTAPSMCVPVHMSRLIDAAHWTLLDWTIETYTRDRPMSEADPLACTYVCAQLAAHGDLARIRLLCGKHEFGWDSDAIYKAARYGHLHVLEWFFGRMAGGDGYGVCDHAARGGHLHVLQWAQSRGFERGGDVCASAAKGGHLTVLQWLRANGCPWDIYTTNCAAQRGHLRVLQWAVANGCPLSAKARKRAHKAGRDDVVAWLDAYQKPSSH